MKASHPVTVSLPPPPPPTLVLLFFLPIISGGGDCPTGTGYHNQKQRGRNTTTSTSATRNSQHCRWWRLRAPRHSQTYSSQPDVRRHATSHAAHVGRALASRHGHSTRPRPRSPPRRPRNSRHTQPPSFCEPRNWPDSRPLARRREAGDRPATTAGGSPSGARRRIHQHCRSRRSPPRGRPHTHTLHLDVSRYSRWHPPQAGATARVALVGSQQCAREAGRPPSLPWRLAPRVAPASRRTQRRGAAPTWMAASHQHTPTTRLPPFPRPPPSPTPPPRKREGSIIGRPASHVPVPHHACLGPAIQKISDTSSSVGRSARARPPRRAGGPRGGRTDAPAHPERRPPLAHRSPPAAPHPTHAASLTCRRG